MGPLKLLTREQIVYRLDKNLPPAVEIEPGEVVCLQTHDARTGTIRASHHLLDSPPPGGGNPATGPIFVKGAQPGDSLAVEIMSIELANEGFIAVKANIGLLAHRAKRFATRMVPVRDGWVYFSDRIKFPVRPMIGVIGTAPAGEGIATAYPGPHGGNMDNLYVSTGAKVHLPVAVPGALLGLGDVHASMGDGEVSMVGVEIAAEVTVRVDLARGASVSRPWIETDAAWVTTGDAPEAVEALRMAAEGMASLLQERLDLSFDDAYMLMSARCDVQVCQLCGPGTFPVTARAVFPRIG
jgi:amidase